MVMLGILIARNLSYCRESVSCTGNVCDCRSREEEEVEKRRERDEDLYAQCVTAVSQRVLIRITAAQSHLQRSE
jgi:hypothetical protein